MHLSRLMGLFEGGTLWMKSVWFQGMENTALRAWAFPKKRWSTFWELDQKSNSAQWVCGVWERNPAMTCTLQSAVFSDTQLPSSAASNVGCTGEVAHTRRQSLWCTVHVSVQERDNCYQVSLGKWVDTSVLCQLLQKRADFFSISLNVTMYLSTMVYAKCPWTVSGHIRILFVHDPN